MEEPIAEFVVRVTEPGNRRHLVSLIDRPGALSFFSAIEYYWYPPQSIKADLYDLRVIKWESLVWMVCSFPGDRLSAAKAMANILRLRVCDGVPTVIGGIPGPGDRVWEGNAVKHFPGSILTNGKDNANMFGIESLRTNPLHNRDNGFNSLTSNYSKLVREREGIVIDALAEKRFPKPLEIYNFIYGFDPHPKW